MTERMILLGDWQAISRRLKEDLARALSPRRYAHTVGAGETAFRLAVRWGADAERARVAGLLHDIAREWRADRLIEACEEAGVSLHPWERKQAEILHGYAGAWWAAREYDFDDDEVLEAVRHHTVGHPGMGLLAKIVYVADKIEPNRTYKGVETLRDLAEQSLDRTVQACLDQAIQHVLRKGTLLHPLTVETRNWLILEQKREDACSQKHS
ncbi:HD domain-containing protein [Heliobacterium gestii]|uniref:bis(5'-nucleosyl)-tetraphosphatase (symmetrical) n=1 Tax=Heliomicrobium gestii TaxID=2699 RepID=A0A845LBJ8_HELGE|nr:bis(5'-nucleosyl)-tetraphosphatase (symmetrical) YqeK [Heliomicrobium gestii]MBM7866872.1 putative HD superfamily hydrolase involved in NAD metabolism [Heliomicrobium gestii]MZP42300.1 HD domain-containing protein [Heliomicrobium gestii]